MLAACAQTILAKHSGNCFQDVPDKYLGQRALVAAGGERFQIGCEKTMK
jgi:hypothetical protein